MRKAVYLLVLILLLVAVYGMRKGWFGPAGTGETPRTATDAHPGQADLVRPSFDVVRADPFGEVVMAGRAEPGWTVSVDSNGKPVGTAVADANGEWTLMPSKPLSKGEHSLELKAQDPKGGRTLFSKQRLALSLSDSAEDRPLVALTEEGKATRVLQTPAQAGADLTGGKVATLNPQVRTDGSADPSKQVSFAAIDYEDAGQQSMLHMNGVASPGGRVALYINNELAGTTTADAKGKWTFSGNRVLAGGAQDIRADLVEAGSNKVLARAEVKFDRELRVAAVEDDEKSPRPALVSKEETQPEKSTQASTAVVDKAAGNSIVVRRGDTLWQIAQRYYGSGAKYTQIFQNNKGQIRNPDLIYPNQRFSLPGR